MTTPARKDNAWLREANDFLRALGGAYLFGIPLLYTLEMWQIGSYSAGWQQLLFLLLAFGLNLVLAHFSGFKQQRPFSGNLEQAIDALAVGVVAAAMMLLVLNLVQWGDPLAPSLGLVVAQAVPLSLGAAIANSLFSTPNHQGNGADQTPPAATRPSALQALLNDVGATLAGGVFIGFSIAPTDEVRMLAARLDFPHALALMVFTGLLSYAIVFTTLHDQDAARTKALPFQNPFTETALAYALALLVAFAILLLLGRIELSEPLHSLLRQVLVLGLPVTVGGAAGRVII